MRRLFAPMNLAVYLVSEWVWMPLWDRLTAFDDRVEAARRVNADRIVGR